MKLKPIESGCLAVIIRSKAGNEGKVVRVGNYLGKVVGFGGVNRWEIDIILRTDKGNTCNHVQEAWLMRIDGEDFSHEIEEETLKKENVK